MNPVCSMFSPECHGRLEWHHGVKQQRLRGKFKHGARWSVLDDQWVAASRHDPVTEPNDFAVTLDQILGDTRNRIWLCTAHHELTTNSRVRPELPQSVWEFADRYGFTAELENDLARRSAA